MTITARPGSLIEPVFDAGVPGLVGTVGLRIVDPPTGAVILPRTTTGITEVAPGVYARSLTVPAPASPGVATWLIAWDHPTDAAVSGVEELIVTSGAPAPGETGGLPLASVAQLRERLNDRGGEVEENMLQAMLMAASAVMEQVRLFHPVPALITDPPVTRRIIVGAGRSVAVPDVRSLTDVKLDGTTVEETAYSLSGLQDEPATRITLRDYGYDGSWAEQRSLDLTGHFGFAQVPPDVVQATLVLASRMYHERNARQADTVADPEGGVYSYHRRLPPFVQHVLDSYRPAWVLA